MAKSQAKKAKAKAPKLLRAFSRSELAEAFNVSPLRITKWAAAGMPVADRGGRGRQSQYELPAVVDWRVRSQVQALTGKTESGGAIDLGLERAKLARAQTEKTDMEIRRRQGELLSRDQVVKDGRAFVMAAKAKLLALPRRMAQAGVIANDAQEHVASLVREALEEMARWRTQMDLLEAAHVAA